MLVNLNFTITDGQQELLSIICSLIKTSFKCKLDICINKENALGNGNVLPELDFIDLTSNLPRGYYVERDGRQINLTKSDFLRYCEVLLSKKLELSEPKEQLEYLRNVGISFPSVQKAFDLTDSEFLSLRSDLVFPYVKAKWQQRFSHLRVQTIDDRETIEAMKKTFKVDEIVKPPSDFDGKFIGIASVEDFEVKMKELGISRSQISRAIGIPMSWLTQFFSGSFRFTDVETIEKFNSKFGTRFVYEDKMTPFLEKLKDQSDSLTIGKFKQACADNGIVPRDVCIALKIKRPSTKGDEADFIENLRKALGKKAKTIDPADFAECKTAEDFTKVCMAQQYSSSLLSKAAGISKVTAAAIIKRGQVVKRIEALEAISNFIGHELEKVK